MRCEEPSVDSNVDGIAPINFTHCTMRRAPFLFAPMERDKLYLKIVTRTILLSPPAFAMPQVCRRRLNYAERAQVVG